MYKYMLVGVILYKISKVIDEIVLIRVMILFIRYCCINFILIKIIILERIVFIVLKILIFFGLK